MFRECDREAVNPPGAAQCTCKLRVHPLPLVRSETECEVGRKPSLIALDPLVQPFGLHTIEPCQIRIQHYPLPADHVDRALDRVGIRLFVHCRESPPAIE